MKAGWRQYEWDVELRERDDPDADIIDHWHAEELLEAMIIAEAHPHSRIVLVMDYEDGRGWAYLDGGALPEEFAQPNSAGEYIPMGIKVPKRYHSEVRQAALRFKTMSESWEGRYNRQR